mgnify:CR=1 FL=1
MLHNIMKYVIRETGQDILNPDRQRDRIDARTLYYILAKENTTASYAKIGKLVGKSHASVMHSYLNNGENMLSWNKDYKEIYDKYNIVSDFSSQLDLVEKIRLLEYEIAKLSYPLTENEIAYRQLGYANAMDYDKAAAVMIKSFEWKNRESKRKEVYEKIECHQ